MKFRTIIHNIKNPSKKDKFPKAHRGRGFLVTKMASPNKNFQGPHFHHFHHFLELIIKSINPVKIHRGENLLSTPLPPHIHSWPRTTKTQIPKNKTGQNFSGFCPKRQIPYSSYGFRTWTKFDFFFFLYVWLQLSIKSMKYP